VVRGCGAFITNGRVIVQRLVAQHELIERYNDMTQLGSDSERQNCDAGPPMQSPCRENDAHEVDVAACRNFSSIKARSCCWFLLYVTRPAVLVGGVGMTTPSSSSYPAVALFDNTYSSTLAFLNSLGEHDIPVNVYGSSMLGATRWSRFASSYQRCPPIDEPAKFLPWLTAQLRAGLITRVAPTSDLIAYYLSALRDEFPPDVRRTIPMLAEMESCLIKSRFAAVCAEKGVATPATFAPTNLDEALSFAKQIGYPLVLKAKSHLAVGMAERGAVVETEQQLRERFVPYDFIAGHECLAVRYPELRLPLLQRFVPSAGQRVYSVSGFKDARLGIVTAALSYKCEQWPPKVGISTHQVGSNNQGILRDGMAAVDQLISCGIFELELLVDGADLLAIDLNPRSFGFMSLDIARGSDLPWLWFQSTLDSLSVFESARPLQVMECRQSLPFYVSRMVMLVSGPNRLQKMRGFWRELGSPWVSMTGQWRDPIPKLLALLGLLRHPGSLVRPYWRSSAHWTVRTATQSANQKALTDNQFGDGGASAAMAALEHLATGAHPRLTFSSTGASARHVVRSHSAKDANR
jgi:D-aspartate ligase